MPPIAAAPEATTTGGMGNATADMLNAPAPPTFGTSTAEEVAASLPARPPDANKATFGRALVIAGSAAYTGAAYLSGAAAYRAGCGLVTLAVPSSIKDSLAALLPEATWLLLPEDMGVIGPAAADVIHAAWGSYDVVLLGPGLTTLKPARVFVDRLFGQSPAPRPQPQSIGFAAEGVAVDAAVDPVRAPIRLVVDADGLNVLAQMNGGGGQIGGGGVQIDGDGAQADSEAVRISRGLALLPPGSVLTPHPGEMARLLGRTSDEVNADRNGIARAAAMAWGHVVVLKGAYTVVAAPDGRVTVNPFAVPALAKAGTGDVLAGLLAGLMAQGMAGYDAAVAATYVHALAGQIAAEVIGPRSVLASEVLAYVAGALREVEGG